MFLLPQVPQPVLLLVLLFLLLSFLLSLFLPPFLQRLFLPLHLLLSVSLLLRSALLPLPLFPPASAVPDPPSGKDPSFLRPYFRNLLQLKISVFDSQHCPPQPFRSSHCRTIDRPTQKNRHVRNQPLFLPLFSLPFLFPFSAKKQSFSNRKSSAQHFPEKKTVFAIFFYHFEIQIHHDSPSRNRYFIIPQLFQRYKKRGFFKGNSHLLWKKQ